MTITANQKDSFYRIADICGDKKKSIRALLPISRTQFYSLVKEGKFPQPIKLGRINLWRVADIDALLKKLSEGVGATT